VVSRDVYFKKLHYLVGIDLARLFNDALSQQSQQIDSNGNYTLTSIYCEFYCELLHRASLGQLMYSDHLKVCYDKINSIRFFRRSFQIMIRQLH
jgi:hypothetical protein